MGTDLQTAGGNVTFWFLGLSSWLVLGSALVDLCAGGVQIPLDSKRPLTHQFSPCARFKLSTVQNEQESGRERMRKKSKVIHKAINCLRKLVIQSSRIQRGMIQASSQRNLEVCRDIGSEGTTASVDSHGAMN